MQLKLADNICVNVTPASGVNLAHTLAICVATFRERQHTSVLVRRLYYLAYFVT